VHGMSFIETVQIKIRKVLHQIKKSRLKV